MQEIMTMINNVGFPIFMSVYMITRLETTIKSNTEVLIKIAERLSIENKEAV